MARATISLPESLEARARDNARERGISFEELVRECLEMGLGASTSTDRREDPIFHPTVWKGETPPDLAAGHDRYLYDDPDEEPPDR